MKLVFTAVLFSSLLSICGLSEDLMRLTCVGDSITFGSKIENPREFSYPAQLQKMLGEKWLVKRLGNSGTTLLSKGNKPYSATPTLEQALASKPNIVVILLGTNDTKPQNWKFKNEFVDDYIAFVKKFQALPQEPKIYLGLPVFVAGEGNFGINEEGIIEQQAMILEVAKKLALEVIDLHAVTKGRDELYADRVHPTAEGAEVMAKEVYRVLTGEDYKGPSTLKEPEPAE